MVPDRAFRRALPRYPRVVVDEDAIVVINDDDERIVWDYEPDGAVARQIASEIEVRLKSISYIRSRLIESLTDIADELLEMNLPVEMLEGVVDDALFDVYRKIPSITSQFKKSENR
jgi:hypothetical protein